MVVDQKNEKTRTQIILLLSYATLYTPNSPDVVWQMRPIQRDQSKKKIIQSILLNISYLTSNPPLKHTKISNPHFFPFRYGT
jgi:hypothetical protein